MTYEIGESATKDGLPRSSFAFAPTDDPATWKLPYLTSTGAPDPDHLPGAAAAVSAGGFRGQKADIPASAMGAVKTRLRQAYRRWGHEPPESLAESLSEVMTEVVTQVRIDAVLNARLAEKDEDDHYYGPWHGGPKSQGGGPLKPGEKPSDKQGTMARYSKDGGKTWDEERLQEVWEPYIEGTMKGVPTSKEPTVYMTGGGPASGKTVGLLQNKDAGIPDPKMAAHINPDDAKAAIPEYKRAVAAGNKQAAANVHEESSHMAKTGTARAITRGHDVVLDTVGDSGIAKLTDKVTRMRAQGAKRVVADYATVNVDTAIKRAQARAIRTGRYVHVAELRRAHRDVSNTFYQAGKTNLFDRLRLWDNNGKTPFLVAEADGKGGFVVHDQKAWSAFLGIGGVTE